MKNFKTLLITLILFSSHVILATTTIEQEVADAKFNEIISYCGMAAALIFILFISFWTSIKKSSSNKAPPHPTNPRQHKGKIKRKR